MDIIGSEDVHVNLSYDMSNCNWFSQLSFNREDMNSSHSSSSSCSETNEETEESVWKINEEQRAYYLNQFRILQPAEKGVITGE